MTAIAGIVHDGHVYLGGDSAGVERYGYSLAVRGRLFEVEGDYQVGEASEGFNAVGCGAPIALGALYATEVADPCDRLIVALGAAERFSAGVRGPFTTVSTKGAAS